MSLRPTDPGPPLSPRQAVEDGRTRARASSSVEREAEEAVASAHRRRKDAEDEAARGIDDIRDEYVKQVNAESLRNETQLENQRARAYEQVRELQRAQQAELARVRQEGEKKIEQTKEYYNSEIETADRTGRRSLEELRTRNMMVSDTERSQGETQLTLARDEYARKVGALDEFNRASLQEVEETSQADRERLKQLQSTAIGEADQKYKDQFRQILGEQDQSLTRLNKLASNELNQTKADYATKLKAYADRSEDPFYRLLDFGAEITENDEAYLLTARIPLHEREGISVVVRGNEVVLSGHRRNQESLSDPTTGQVRSTHAYQTFSQSFPISFPVDPRAVSREFDGERLSVIIPKKPTYEHEAFKAKKPVAPISAERPKFPENLVIAEKDEPQKKSRQGSGTLT